MSEWRWLTLESILTIHDEQIGRNGGLAGIRDESLLRSALARPQNLAACGSPDAAELAASYAFGIARNHPFADGNKRTAFIAGMLFLSKNEYTVQFSEVSVVLAILRLAAGEMEEAELAHWFRSGMQSGLHEDAAPYVAATKKPSRKTKPRKAKPKPKAWRKVKRAKRRRNGG